MQSENQFIHLPILESKGITLAVKREDELHPFISGNKYRKLKYNLQEAKKENIDTLLTFGGAFSNHILATAVAGKEKSFKTIGIIRGDELRDKWHTNPTLKLAHKNGMQFKFVSREVYRTKEQEDFITDLKSEFGSFYLIPEGGTNALAIKGCEEILTDSDTDFDVVCTCVGTGGTVAGLINSAKPEQQIIGFSTLKGNFLENEIKKWVYKNNWQLNTDYHFGGYGKVTAELVEFINSFRIETGISLDPIYTGKMIFGLLDRVKNDSFVTGTNILAIHTGGLQGIAGMNMILKKKNLPLLRL
ncbi:1-aminocyclopropane-1-carboxylate deaminase/D-cysteine desulfhydrase [Maribacter sp. 2210JD10-5]|uniref:1-aminocyclopropane-1-carboxylate deaminase/D-cysteine desulfhydrase n=1 Tax=Maribacter sp. 2210JD10-5 TaxID=3386272 RepID=UPI0039BD0DFF